MQSSTDTTSLEKFKLLGSKPKRKKSRFVLQKSTKGKILYFLEKKENETQSNQFLNKPIETGATMLFTDQLTPNR